MPVSFLPRILADNLTELTPALLSKRGLRGLFLDFDNTIVPYTTDVPTAEMDRWLSEMQSSGIFLCVVSNSRRPRVVRFCEARGIACVTHSGKPFQKGIRRALELCGLPPSAVALAGDQIFTDVLGANCGGLTSILVRPIHLHNIWLRLRHLLEKPFIHAARGRRF